MLVDLKITFGSTFLYLLLVFDHRSLQRLESEFILYPIWLLAENLAATKMI